MEKIPEQVRNAALAHLEAVDAAAANEERASLPSGRLVDVLWGWGEIAQALGIHVDTAREFAKKQNLPVARGGGRMVRSTVADLSRWARVRADENDNT